MKLHADEMALARAYAASLDFEGLTEDQTREVMKRGRELFHWFKAHPAIHNIISTLVLIAIFAADYLAQVRLPAWLLTSDSSSSTPAVLVAAALAGGLHSWLLYSLAVYSMHEGAAHRLIYPPRGRISAALHWLSANLARISAAEPKQYATH